MHDDITSRVNALKVEIEQLQLANHEYLSKARHSVLEMRLHADRETRLQQILAELAAMTKGKGP